MDEHELIRRLEALGADTDLIAEVRSGTLRQADYTKKTQELSQLRDQVAMALGRQQAGGASAPKRKVDEYLEQFEGEEAANVRSLLGGLVEAIRADMKAETAQELRPVVEATQSLSWSQALDQRLETELVPMYGEGIRGDWPRLKADMMQALSRNESVYPKAYVLEHMPEKAQAYIAQRAAQDTKQKSASTTEGFAKLSSSRPGMTGGRPVAPGAANGNGNGKGAVAEAPVEPGGGRRSPQPSSQGLEERFLAIAGQVSEAMSET